MPLIRIYIAQSLDGYIARLDGAIDWLRPFDTVDYSYEKFFADIGTVVMGRKSYELARSFGDWPYAAARSRVRIGPGSNKLTRSFVVATSAAQV